MADVLKQVQEDCHGRALAAETLEDVAVILVRKDYTEQELKRMLGVVHGRNGKVGAAVLVQMPVITVPDPDVPGPRTQIVQSFVVLEHPTLNAGSNGCGKSAEQIAIAVAQLFHHFTPYGVTQCFTAAPAAIVPDFTFDGLVAYSVQVQTFLALGIPSKVSTPKITAAGLTVTITCPTAGAAILYSIDCSYPTLEYTGPITLEAAATVRAVGTLEGRQQSDVASLQVS